MTNALITRLKIFYPNESLAFAAFLAPAPAEDDEVGPPPAYAVLVELVVTDVENTSIVEVELLLGGCSAMTKTPLFAYQDEFVDGNKSRFACWM
jgi:hypothetical protein